MERDPDDQPGPGAPEVPAEELPGQITIDDVEGEPRPESDGGPEQTPAEPSVTDDDPGAPAAVLAHG